MARLSLHKLTKHFPAPHGRTIRALDSLEVDIADGEWLALVGPSGCGKTTTLRLVAGLEHPDSGTVALDGKPINGVSARDRDMAMVFQSGALFPHLTAFENIGFGLQVRSTPKDEIRQKVSLAAEALGIQACLDRRPFELSSGQKQRVALARALVRSPAVFLFDEPLASLDPVTRSQLRSELIALSNRSRTSAIFVTHDQHEALALGHRVGVLQEGVLQQIGAPLDLYNRPANLFVAGFIGSPPMNLLHGSLNASSSAFEFRLHADLAARNQVVLQLPARNFPALQNFHSRDIVLGIRPEHFLSEDPSSDGFISFQGTLQAVEITGPDKFLHVNWQGTLLIARASVEFPATSGETVWLHAALTQLRVFDRETGKAIL